MIWHDKSQGARGLFGVKHGDIRKVAAKIKINNQLAMDLWETSSIDARRAARAGWSLTSERISKNPDGLDLPALLTSPFAPIWINEMVRRQG